MRPSLVLICALSLAACPQPEPEPETVTMWGQAYTLGSSASPTGDVLIEFEEELDLSATSDAYGYWELEVPADATLTPRASHPDFVTMHLQTFTSAGEDIERVGVQMVSPVLYGIFEMDLGLETDPEKCQVSMTVNTIEVRDLDLDEFRAYGHHGVEGATMAVEPAVPDIVYFNEATRPTWELTETTIDGGAVAPNIDPGVYAFQAEHPTRSFAPFVATCVAGRFINAGPPWGPREIE